MRFLRDENGQSLRTHRREVNFRVHVQVGAVSLTLCSILARSKRAPVTSLQRHAELAARDLFFHRLDIPRRDEEKLSDRAMTPALSCPINVWSRDAWPYHTLSKTSAKGSIFAEGSKSSPEKYRLYNCTVRCAVFARFGEAVTMRKYEVAAIGNHRMLFTGRIFPLHAQTNAAPAGARRIRKSSSELDAFFSDSSRANQYANARAKALSDNPISRPRAKKWRKRELGR